MPRFFGPWVPDPDDTRQFDPDFLEGVNAAADVEVDSNATGSTRSTHSGVGRGPYVAVAGLTNVPIILGRGKQDVLDLDNRTVAIQRWYVLFPTQVSLDVNHRLRVPDRDQAGVYKYLYVWASSNNAFMRDHHWRVDAIEYVRPAALPSPSV